MQLAFCKWWQSFDVSLACRFDHSTVVLGIPCAGSCLPATVFLFPARVRAGPKLILVPRSAPQYISISIYIVYMYVCFSALGRR